MLSRKALTRFTETFDILHRSGQRCREPGGHRRNRASDTNSEVTDSAATSWVPADRATRTGRHPAPPAGARPPGHDRAPPRDDRWSVTGAGFGRCPTSEIPTPIRRTRHATRIHSPPDHYGDARFRELDGLPETVRPALAPGREHAARPRRAGRRAIRAPGRAPATVRG
jgi:hypothetical protein